MAFLKDLALKVQSMVHDYDSFKQIICSDMPMPDQWLVILERWQQHALTDASDLLMHFKKNDRT